MHQKLTQIFNRTQNRNFNFKTDNFDFEYLQEVESDIQKNINEHLLDRPETTCNWLKSIYKQIEKGQEYIHKRYILEIQERIILKKNNATIAKEEDENFEEAFIILGYLDNIKQMIIQAVQTVKPDLIKPKKSKTKEVSSKKTNEKAIFLKPNGEKYKAFQIAFYAFYQDLKVKDPKYDKHNTLKNLAINFDLDNKTSAERIYNEFYRPITKSFEEENKLDKIFEALYLKTNISYKTIKKYIEEIIPLLKPEHKKKAENHINSLDLLIN